MALEALSMVAVIIPNWNGLDFIEPCLDSLLSQTEACEIIVVDNGSVDGSKELVRSKYPKVHLIELGRNYGFAGGVNRGIDYALEQGAAWVALFNNDAVADSNWLKQLLTAADKHPEAAVITSKFLRLGGKRIDSTGDCYSVWGFSFPRGRDELDRGQYDVGEYAFSGTGGASLYRAGALQEVGLFDEVFFAYYEDIDLSFRMNLAGWRVWYEPTSVAFHHVGGTTGFDSDFARYHTLKNFPLLYLKNMPGWLYWRFLPLSLMAYGMMIVRDLLRGRAMVAIRGLGAAHWHLPGALFKRWRIQRTRKVTTAEIKSRLYPRIPPTQRQLLHLAKRLHLERP